MNWKQEEKGNNFVLKLSTLITKYCPQFVVRYTTLTIVSYYYWRDRKKTASEEYFTRLQQTYPQVQLPKHARFKQYVNFGNSIADRFYLWQVKKLNADFTVIDPHNIVGQMQDPEPGQRGQILFFSHLGDIQICQAFFRQTNFKKCRLNILMDVETSKKFNQTLKSMQKSDQLINHFPVDNLDPQTMLELEKRIAQGQWLVIPADRLDGQKDRTQEVEFLGKKARFPTGPWLLASLLQAPINTIFCFKEGQKYKIYIDPLVPALKGKRKEREQEISKYLPLYVKRLEEYCAKYPTMWFNFYNYWD